MMPYFERAIIFDVRARPHMVTGAHMPSRCGATPTRCAQLRTSNTGTRDLQTDPSTHMSVKCESKPQPWPMSGQPNTQGSLQASGPVALLLIVLHVGMLEWHARLSKKLPEIYRPFVH